MNNQGNDNKIKFLAVVTNLDFRIDFHNAKYSQGAILYNEQKEEWQFDPEEDYWDFDLEINGYKLENAIDNRKKSLYNEYLEDLFELYLSERNKEALQFYSKADCIDLIRTEISVMDNTKKGFYDDVGSIFEKIHEPIPGYFGEQPSFPLLANTKAKIICSEPEKLKNDDNFIKACISDFLVAHRSVIKKAIDHLEQKLEWAKLSNEQAFSFKILNSLQITTTNLVWCRNDTDLLELVTALMEMKAIGNSHNNLTRKEAIETFSKFFNREIKDAESKLSRATERKKDVSPFLKSLKESFDNYAIKKEQK